MSTVFAQVNHVSICCNAKCEKKDIFRDVFFLFLLCGAVQRVFRRDTVPHDWQFD